MKQTTIIILMTIAFNSYSQDNDGVHFSTSPMLKLSYLGQSNATGPAHWEAKPEPQIGSFIIKVPCNCVCEPEPKTLTDKISDYYDWIVDGFKTKKKKRVGP